MSAGNLQIIGIALVIVGAGIGTLAPGHDGLARPLAFLLVVGGLATAIAGTP